MTEEMKIFAMATSPSLLYAEAELVESEGSYLEMSHMRFTADELRLMAKWLEGGKA